MSVYSGSSALKYAKENKIDYDVAVVLMSRGKKGASAGAKKAQKIEEEKKEEESYEKIVGDDK